MAHESAIQVVFKPEEAERIRAIAKGMHMSASAYVRAQVLSRSGPSVLGWWCEPFTREESDLKNRILQREVGAGRMVTQHPDLVFERALQHPDATAEYTVFSYSGEPLTDGEFRRTFWHQQGFDRSRVMLAGSNRLMKVISSVADIRLGGQLRWTLAVDTSVPDRGDG